ncbi:hypothetical protein AB0B12_26110 [Streptomyces sp. NPDC044780]|uniref:hypothetical protein n=1 Tax=unclassified Streptomyces TaxID=2593676 RepID=UPI00340CB71E
MLASLTGAPRACLRDLLASALLARLRGIQRVTSQRIPVFVEKGEQWWASSQPFLRPSVLVRRDAHARGERHLVLLEVREVLDGRFPVA